MAGAARGAPGSRGSALLYAMLACSLWGFSAVAAQVIFDTYSLPPLALVAIRMPVAGALLLLFFRPRRPTARLGTFVVFSILGLWLVQYSYLLTIAASNAATGTLFQFLGLPMIAAYEVIASRTKATLATVCAVAISFAGTAELVAGSSNGSLALLVTPLALGAGLVSAATAAYYIIQSKSLIALYGSTGLTAWGLLVGSLVAVPSGLASVSRSSLTIPKGGLVELIALILFVALVGTLTTFTLYFKGLERISPTEAGIVSALEPITATIVSFFVLHVVLTPFQYLGGVLIIVGVAAIVLRPSPPARRPGIEVRKTEE